MKNDFKMSANLKNKEAAKFEREELKSAPRGFDKEHPDVDLLRKKGFIAIRNFTDAEVLDKNCINELDKTYKALRPFFDYMSMS